MGGRGGGSGQERREGRNRVAAGRELGSGGGGIAVFKTWSSLRRKNL